MNKIVICNTKLLSYYEYQNFDYGKKYNVSRWTKDYYYVYNNLYITIRFNKEDFEKNFCNLEQWREQQLNKLLDKWISI